jgi:hypothetical protein
MIFIFFVVMVLVLMDNIYCGLALHIAILLRVHIARIVLCMQ